MKKVFIALLVAGSLYSCSKPVPPTFVAVQDLTLIDKVHENISFRANVVFHNPNRIVATVKSSEVMVSANGVHITTIKQEKDSEIASKSDFIIPVAGTFSLQDLVKDEAKFLEELLPIIKGKRLTLHFKGTTVMKVGNLEYEIPLKYAEELKW